MSESLADIHAYYVEKAAEGGPDAAEWQRLADELRPRAARSRRTAKPEPEPEPDDAPRLF